MHIDTATGRSAPMSLSICVPPVRKSVELRTSPCFMVTTPRPLRPFSIAGSAVSVLRMVTSVFSRPDRMGAF